MYNLFNPSHAEYLLVSNSLFSTNFFLVIPTVFDIDQIEIVAFQIPRTKTQP